MEIGEKIRYYRENMGYTQKELAELIHVSKRTIGHYETGERSPNIAILQLLAKSLNVKMEDFFKIEEEKTEDEKRENEKMERLNYTSLTLLINAARTGNKELARYSECIHDFVKSVNNKYSKIMLSAVIKKVIETYETLSDEIKTLNKEWNENDKEIAKKEKIILNMYEIGEVQEIVMQYLNEVK